MFCFKGFLSGLSLVLVMTMSTALQARTANSYNLPFQVHVGDRFVVTIKKQRTTTKDNVTTKTPVVTSVYDGKFTKVIKSGYHMQWKLRTVEVDNAGKKNPQLQKMFASLNMFKSLTLSVETNKAGQPVRIFDMPTLIEKMIATLKKLGKSDERTLGMVRQMYNRMGERTAALVLFKDALILSVFQNRNLELGAAYNMPAKAPNPLGGPAIEMSQQLSLVQVNNSKKTARYRFNSKLDPKSMETSMLAAIKKMLANIPDDEKRKQAGQALTKGMRMEKNTSAKAEVSTTDGWVRKVETVENSKVSTPKGKGGRRDWSLITVERVK